MVAKVTDSGEYEGQDGTPAHFVRTPSGNTPFKAETATECRPKFQFGSAEAYCTDDFSTTKETCEAARRCADDQAFDLAKGLEMVPGHATEAECTRG